MLRRRAELLEHAAPRFDIGEVQRNALQHATRLMGIERARLGFQHAGQVNLDPAQIGKHPPHVGRHVVPLIAFEVEKPAQVDALYRKALSLGATDEGPPGDRGDGYYGAYFRDLDGNKLNFHCWT